MTTGLKNEQKELADFIRVGSARGHQCFGSYFDEQGGSCALGAVYEGVYHLPRNHGTLGTGSSRAAVPLSRRGHETMSAGMPEAAAARVDDRAPERRPSFDARTDRGVAHTGIQRLIGLAGPCVRTPSFDLLAWFNATNALLPADKNPAYDGNFAAAPPVGPGSLGSGYTGTGDMRKVGT